MTMHLNIVHCKLSNGDLKNMGQMVKIWDQMMQKINHKLQLDSACYATCSSSTANEKLF